MTIAVVGVVQNELLIFTRTDFFLIFSGFQTSLELAMCGAHVILACRDPAKGNRAAERILERRVRGVAPQAGRGGWDFV